MMSVLLFGSSYNKNKKISLVCYIVMLLSLLIKQIGNVNIIFLIINLLSLAILPLMIKKIQNKYINGIASVISIIIWSMFIDIVCYYMFPNFVFNQSLAQYIGAGVAFNLKFVPINLLALIGYNCIDYLLGNIKELELSKLRKN